MLIDISELNELNKVHEIETNTLYCIENNLTVLKNILMTQKNNSLRK
jgi:hypothetical protein